MVEIRGLPFPFLITTRNVAAGEPLLRSYGQEWWKALKSKLTFQPPLKKALKEEVGRFFELCDSALPAHANEAMVQGGGGPAAAAPAAAAPAAAAAVVGAAEAAAQPVAAAPQPAQAAPAPAQPQAQPVVKQEVSSAPVGVAAQPVPVRVKAAASAEHPTASSQQRGSQEAAGRQVPITSRKASVKTEPAASDGGASRGAAAPEPNRGGYWG